VADRIRFHLDEHIHPAVAKALRKFGVDVTTTVEAGLRTEDDQAHLGYAIEAQRVIVTHDADFLRLAAQTPDHPGIAYCHKDRRTVSEIIRTLILIFEILEPGEMAGRIEFL